MTGENLQLWLSILVLILTVVNLVYTWFNIRHKATKENIDDLTDVTNNLVRRVSVMEERYRTAPTHNDLGKLYDKVNSFGGKIENVSGTLEAIKGQLALINEHLINGGKR